MQGIAETVFWAGVALVVYTYVGYPVLVGVLARLRPAVVPDGEFAGSVTVILAARDEEQAIARRLNEFSRLLLVRGQGGEIIVVSDGSTDGTAEEARRCSSGVPIRLIELQDNVGKAAAISLAAQQAHTDVLVLADVRQRWSPDALERLLQPLNDARFGAVTGDLVLERDDGVMAGVGMYWRFEKWLRRNESLVHSTVGVSGSICAVRRELFEQIPPGTLLDDVYWPMRVVMKGYRVAHCTTAIAFDRLPAKPRDEFRRKIRTLSGNFQLIGVLPALLVPWRNPIWMQFISHKILRLVVPWALIAILFASALASGTFYRVALAAQVFLYAAGSIGLFTTLFRQSPVAAAAGSFMMLNAAAWFSFFLWVSGRASRSWSKVRYASSAEQSGGAVGRRRQAN